MAEIVVLGGGMIGLTTAMLLANDGHRVTVLERDPAAAPDPADAWDSWDRPGVGQFRLGHIMLARWHQEMRRELPGVIDALLAAGGARVNVMRELPETLTGPDRPDDSRFDLVTARRPVLEAVLAAAAQRLSNLTVVRGASVTGLIAATRQRTAVPHVAGVLTRSGHSYRADLVIDATGRRSAVPAMVQAIGAGRPTETREDSGFVYYLRHFRAATSDTGRPPVGASLLSHFDSVSLLALPADSNTWCVGFIAAARDKRIRALRHTTTWQRALDLYPLHRPWSRGVPLTDIQCFSGIEDRCRTYVPDGVPVVTGLVPVGDAWSCTNPSLGRGATIGLLHAQSLRDVLRTTDLASRDAGELVCAFDDATRRDITPLIDASVKFTRHRLADIDADINGRPPDRSDPAWAGSMAVYAAAHRDPDVLRAYVEIANLLAPPEQALAAPGLMAKVMQHGAGASSYFLPGPTRAELLQVLAGEPALL